MPCTRRAGVISIGRCPWETEENGEETYHKLQPLSRSSCLVLCASSISFSYSESWRRMANEVLVGASDVELTSRVGQYNSKRGGGCHPTYQRSQCE
jgi:hypothetical protein